MNNRVYSKEQIDNALNFWYKKLQESVAEDNSVGSVVHQGKSITQWCKDFKGEFTPAQVYRMASSGMDLQRYLLSMNDIITLDDSEDLPTAEHTLGLNESEKISVE